MSTLTVTLGPQATFSLADYLQGFDGTIDEVIIVSQTTGEKQQVLGLDKAAEAYKGTLALSLASDKELTADTAKPLRVVLPTADLFVSTIPGAVDVYKAQQVLNAEKALEEIEVVK